MELQSFTIDDPMQLPLRHAVEVTLLLTGGERRWCCFATPKSLTSFGDLLGDTQTRIHFGLPHMIVLENVSAEAIAVALTQIDQDGSIREISKPIELDGRDSDSDVWVFNGAGANFPSAVFHSRMVAENWIQKYSLDGTLTRYPIDVPAYDWALKHELFKPKREDQRIGEFIGRFTSASQEHYHYERGNSSD